jgi:two-component system phosphate regulon sensor histidine kinase PhoR
MDSGAGKQAHEPVDLHALALEVIDQMSLLAVDKLIELRRPGGPAVVVAGDRDRLKQILVNLLDNAIKYTPRGGIVSVESGKRNDMGFVVIEDNGIGIDPIHHHRVFDRFYRVSTDRGDMGAGLGLAIVKSICNAHEGSIDLCSAPEIGSAFRIEIPLMPAIVSRSIAAANTAV